MVEKNFRLIADKMSEFVGSPTHFIFWLFLTLVWLIAGPFMGFSQSWNFWANTSTTVFTFLIALLIQNTQNRSTKEIELKIDELIIALKEPKNEYIDLSKLSDKDLEKLKDQMIERESSKKITRKLTRIIE